MRKILIKSLSTLMALLMITTSVIPAFAEGEGPTNPITNITISNGEGSGTYFNFKNNVLYIDQEQTAKLDLTIEAANPNLPTDETIICSESDINANEAHVTHEYDPSDPTHLNISISKKANAKSTFTLTTSSKAYTFDIVKCIGLNDFAIKYDTAIPESVKNFDTHPGTYNTITPFASKAFVVGTSIDNNNSSSNDYIKFSVFKNPECTIPVSQEEVAIEQTDINGPKTSACTIKKNANEMGDYYLKAENVAYQNCGIARDKFCVIRMSFIEYSYINDITFDSPVYTLNTLDLKALDLKSHMTINPDNAIEPITFTSSNTKVVTVDEKTGYITVAAPGEADIIVKGTESGKEWSCKVIVEDKYVAKDITTNLAVALSGTTFNYTRSEIKPTVKSVKYNGAALTLGTDYVVEYKNNIEVGTGEVHIKGINRYYGDYIVGFTITPYTIASKNVASIPAQTYTGAELCPLPTITYNGYTLVWGVDYTLAYSNNVNAAAYNAKTNPPTVTIIGMGNYAGIVTKTYTIAQAALDTAAIAPIDSMVTTGTALTPEPTVIWNNRVLVKDVDYKISAYKNNVNPGIATVSVSGLGNFKGTKAATFVIVPTAPTGIKATATTASSITLAWTPQANCSGYYIFKLNGNNLSLVGTVTDKKTGTYTINKLGAGKVYSYVVVAYVTGSDKVNYQSPISMVCAVATKPKKTSIKSLKAGKKSFKVAWKKASYTGYEIQYSTSSKFEKKKTKTVNIKKAKTTSTTVKKLTSKKTYYVRVRTYKKVKLGTKTKIVYSSWSKASKVKVK